MSVRALMDTWIVSTFGCREQRWERWQTSARSRVVGRIPRRGIAGHLVILCQGLTQLHFQSDGSTTLLPLWPLSPTAAGTQDSGIYGASPVTFR